MQFTMEFQEVQDRVCQLEGAIKRLDSVRKHLSRNASDIKTEIHASVSKNLECLRGREVDLLGTVDQVLGLKEDALQAQQARLNQALGVLTTSLSMATSSDPDGCKQLLDTLQRLNTVELSPEETPHISFRANQLSLREAILNYGRVDANGLPLATAFEDPAKPSASLPRHIEDYEDAEHHVFNKTVKDQSKETGTGTSVNINVTIPKLSTRPEDWLQRREPLTPATSTTINTSNRTATMAPPRRPCSLPNSARSKSSTAQSTPGSSCSLNNWLSIIKHHADLEEEHDFEISDNTTTSIGHAENAMCVSANSSKGIDLFKHIPKDSTCWLRRSSCEEKKTSSTDFFSHIPTDTKVWLAKAHDQLTALKPSCVTTSSPSPYNMFAHISKDPSQWLCTAVPHCSKPTTRHTVSSSSNASRCDMSRHSHDLFSHISANVDDWLANKNRSTKALESSPSIPANKWLQASQAAQPQKDTVQKNQQTFQLEDVCRANEMCCSMRECVSKPDCVAMFLNNDPASPSKIKNQKDAAVEVADMFPHIKTMQSDIWLMPSSRLNDEKDCDDALKKASLDIESLDISEKYDEVREKENEKDAEQKEKNGENEEGIAEEMEVHDDNSFFHVIAGLHDPMWLNGSSVSGKIVKEEENLWLRKVHPAGSPLGNSSLSSEWLMMDKTRDNMSTERETDSEGWSVVSDSYSIHSEQIEVDVAAADCYINKWLL